MRKKFILYILIPLVILLVVTYIFIDRWVEAGLERLGEEAVGAKVEIDHLHLTLSPLAIQFERMQVANPNNPWTNLFETRKVRFAMDPGQLLRNKYIIETAEINELLVGTRRATDGALPEGRRRGGDSFIAQTARALETSVRQAPLFDPAELRRLFNVDSLLDLQALSSVRHLDSMKQVVATARQQWDATQRDIEQTRQQVAQVEASVRAIKVEELKTVEGVTGAIVTVQNARQTVDDVTNTYRNRRDSISAVASRISRGVGEIEDVVRRDYERILRLARLPDLSARGIAELILGKEIFRKSADVLYWVDLVRSKIQKYKPKPEIEVPRRLEGQDISFPVERSYPRLWIKRILVSGGAGQLQDSSSIRLKGEVHDISNNQELTGNPLTAALEGEHGSGIAANLGALIDRRGSEPFDQYKASVRGIRISDFELGQSDFLPAQITRVNLSGNLHIDVPGDRFAAQADLGFTGMELAFALEPRNTIERLVRNVLTSVRGFNAGLQIRGGSPGFGVGLTTDLDGKIAAGIKDVAGTEFARLQSEFRAGIDKRIAALRTEVEKRSQDYLGSVRSGLGNVDTLLVRANTIIGTRTQELQQRLEKLKTGGAQKAIEGILKKRK